MAVYRAKKIKSPDIAKDAKPVSADSMKRLAQLMNDSPSIVRLANTEWRITSLKPAVQMIIAEEACKVIDHENMAMGDIIKQFSLNLTSVAKCLTLALLNDKERLFKDYKKREYSDEYHQVLDTLLWGEYQMRDWGMLLYEVLTLINTDFFYESISVIKTVRQMTLERKMTKAEAQS